MRKIKEKECSNASMAPLLQRKGIEVAEPRYSKRLSTTQEYSARQRRTGSAGSVDDST
jgi:hypothetical protein